MTDLERRLTEGLLGAADRSPHPGDLSVGARDRLRRRRRTTGAVVAAALAVVAVPVAVGLVAGGPGGSTGDPGAGAPTDGPSGEDVRSLGRTESWRDLSVTVPADWRHGGGSDWCTSGRGAEATSPQVSRPGGVVPTIACSPATGYGAHFTLPGSGEHALADGEVERYRGIDRYPDGAWVGQVATEQATLTVVTGDRGTTQRILDSATPVGEVDANGCATRAEMLSASTDERASVCRYATDGWLEQSERLSAVDTAQATSALRDTVGSRTGDPVCPPSESLFPVITVVAGGLEARLLPSEACGLATVFVLDGRERLLTEDVLYWALSPGWSGYYVPDVPVPEQLRGE